MTKGKVSIVMVLSTMAVFSCSKKEDYKVPEIKVNQKYEDILKSLRAGGQPGEIVLNGAVVKSDGTVIELITMEQTVGASAEKTEIYPSKIPKLNAELKRKDDYKPTKFETFLNVGCDLKGDSRVEGMTESKNKPNEFGITDTFGAVASMVDKIFICGKVETYEAVVVLNANEVIMDGAELSMKMTVGLISITADVLSVEGKNTILTAGASDSSASLISAPSIKLSIFEKVNGNGDLKLKSTGGNYIAYDSK